MDQMIMYPIGEASFTNLREDNAVYVDKTALIYQLVKQEGLDAAPRAARGFQPG